MLSLLGRTWHSRGKFDQGKSLFENFLKVRNFSREQFPEARLENLEDPWLFADMKRAVERVSLAIRNKEHILLFGDYDLDGMSGTAILYLTLKHLGAEVSCRLPTRSDGYGFSQKFAAEAHDQGIGLVITVDCGISNALTIREAKLLGIDVIVTDHHTVPEELPAAYAILHPLRPAESFPEKALTGAGVAFFFALALLEASLGKEKIRSLTGQLLELAVLGTVADCGILLGQNRLITLLGIEALRRTRHPGLRALLEASGTRPETLNAEAIAFYLAPRLNVAGRLKDPSLALDLLCRDFRNAPQAMQELEVLNRTRQDMVEAFVQEAETLLEKDLATAAALIVKSASWPAGVIGLIAARLAEKYDRPAIVLEEGTAKLTASARGPEDFHLARSFQEIARTAPDLFLTFGGHVTAAGFSLLPEQFSRFAEYFMDIVRRERGSTPPVPKSWYDLETAALPSFEDMADLEQCQPFGSGNPTPSFLFPRLSLVRKRKIGKKENHLLLSFQETRGSASGTFFRHGELFSELSPGERLDVLASPEVKTWQGRSEVHLKIQDLRRSS